MIWRGINLLAVAALVLLVVALGLAAAGTVTENLWLQGNAAVCALVAIGTAVLAVLEDML